MLSKIEKRELKIFLVLLIITTFVMGLTLKVSYTLKLGEILGSLVAVQMLMPAFCVMLSEIICEEKDKILYKFNISYIIFTIVSYVILIIGIITKNDVINMIFSLVITTFNVLLIAIYFREKKELRKERNYLFVNKRESIFFCVLFVFLFFIRAIISLLIARESISEFFININWRLLLILIPNYFFSLFFFFGEEFGWRYFLQPKLQKLFGKRFGVILLGFIWGVWHIFISMFYYSPETFIQQAFIQVFFCIALGIFIGLSYMVTENLWVPTIIHYMNNNIAAAVSGGDFSNQIITWEIAIFTVVMNFIVFGVFIFAKKYRKDKSISA